MLATGETVLALAAKHNYTEQAFYDAIKGRTKSKPIRNIISVTTGYPVDELWPEDSEENA